MEDLRRRIDIVKHVLEESTAARNSDWVLFYEVCKFINPSVANAKFGTVLKSHKEYGLPGFETISRCRRKIVETHPELIGTEEVEGGRWSNEVVFKEFAKGEYV